MHKSNFSLSYWKSYQYLTNINEKYVLLFSKVDLQSYKENTKEDFSFDFRAKSCKKVVSKYEWRGTEKIISWQ